MKKLIKTTNYLIALQQVTQKESTRKALREACAALVDVI